MTKLEKRDIIDKHSNERARKQRVHEKVRNRLNSEKEGSRGYEDELKKTVRNKRRKHGDLLEKSSKLWKKKFKKFQKSA